MGHQSASLSSDPESLEYDSGKGMILRGKSLGFLDGGIWIEGFQIQNSKPS